MGEIYNKHFWKARITMISVGAISGMAEVFLLPFISAIGLVALPAIGLYKLINREKGACNYFKAMGFCLLGLAGTLTFIAVSAYFIPLVWSCALFATAIVISISINVYKMAKKPPLQENTI